jgi:hypothetical protein
MSEKQVLNIGGNSKAVVLPPCYQRWQHVLLDTDPTANADIICDARNLTSLPASSFDAVYCSHNLEHYYIHDAIAILRGFLHVLKDDGFAHICVPDIGELMRTVVEKELDISDVVHHSLAGAITVRDMIYGLQREIEESGQDFSAYKNGFTQRSLAALLTECGFMHLYPGTSEFEIVIYAFKAAPGAYAKQLLSLQRWGE